MPQLHVYPHRQFPSHLNWQAVSFMRIEWPSILLGGHRLGTETYPADCDPIHFVVIEQHMLISYAAIMHLALPHAGDTYAVAAFGNVFTFPAFRGEGYGRQVVDAAVHSIQTSTVDVGIVFCKPHLLPFYRASGWESLDGAGTRVGTPDSFTDHSYHRLILFVSDHGRRARSLFAQFPLYINSPW
jgi:GNAT superfamily N-acetyltransferase